LLKYHTHIDNVFSLLSIHLLLIDLLSIKHYQVFQFYLYHEHFDGNGYPNKLKNEEIPIVARITAVADVFDALGSKRPYKEGWAEEKCIDYIKEKSGSQFDPQVVDSFLKNIDKIKLIKDKYQD